MGEHTPPSEPDEQKPETPQERIDRRAQEILERLQPEKVGQDELFDASPYDVTLQGEIEAARIVAGVAAQNEAAVRERDARRATEEAAEMEGKTPKERAALRAQRMLDRVRQDDAEVNAGVSDARKEQTSPFLVSTEASVKGAAQIEAAQKAVKAAAALAPAAAADERKEAAIDAAHKGAEPAHRVLQAIADRNQAIEEDRNMSALDDAYRSATANEALALTKLEAVKAVMDKIQGEPPPSLRGAYHTFLREYDLRVRARKALGELIDLPKRRAAAAAADESNSEVSDHEDEPS